MQKKLLKNDIYIEKHPNTRKNKKVHCIATLYNEFMSK